MKRHLATTLTFSLCAAALSSACVRQNDYDALQHRVQIQDQQLRQIQPVQADVWAQVQSMRQELNALKGQLDDLQLAGGARALAEKINRHEAALRQLETSLALNLNLDAPATMPGGTAFPVAGGGMETQPPTASEGAPAGMPASTAAGTMTTAPPPQPHNASPALKKDMGTTLYEAGMAAFNIRKYRDAERSLVDFTKNYPGHKQVSSAWYYIGECLFQENRFADAALAYDTVITKYSGSSHAPAAYLKQGIAFSKLGQKAAAKARLQELLKKYPNSTEAARARSFLQTNR